MRSDALRAARSRLVDLQAIHSERLLTAEDIDELLHLARVLGEAVVPEDQPEQAPDRKMGFRRLLAALRRSRRDG